MMTVKIKVIPIEEPITHPSVLRWNFSTTIEANAFIEGFREGQGWAVISHDIEHYEPQDQLQLSILEDINEEAL